MWYYASGRKRGKQRFPLCGHDPRTAHAPHGGKRYSPPFAINQLCGTSAKNIIPKGKKESYAQKHLFPAFFLLRLFAFQHKFRANHFQTTQKPLLSTSAVPHAHRPPFVSARLGPCCQGRGNIDDTLFLLVTACILPLIVGMARATLAPGNGGERHCFEIDKYSRVGRGGN